MLDLNVRLKPVAKAMFYSHVATYHLRDEVRILKKIAERYRALGCHIVLEDIQKLIADMEFAIAARATV